ncbi:hypothetical protein GCM10020221_13900 [Streptomyces thioluteus]|uniref:Uncharacterized protein n=1 Tax=Streptomyces thioluteus TaxID=66431 RepID=A0ABP6J2T2_STRTU
MGVELGAPLESAFADGRAMGGAGGGAMCGGADGVDEQGRRGPGGRGFAGAGGAVEADDGVEVDRCPSLVLGDFRERKSGVAGEVGLGDACGGGEVAADVAGEAVPEFAGVGVPEDVCGVVVAGGAQRLSDECIVCAVDGRAAEGTAVFAAVGASAGVAAGSVGGGAVDGAEAGGGEGDEEPGMFPDGVGDGFAAGESGADEVVGVSGVEV